MTIKYSFLADIDEKFYDMEADITLLAKEGLSVPGMARSVATMRKQAEAMKKREAETHCASSNALTIFDAHSNMILSPRTWSRWHNSGSNL